MIASPLNAFTVDVEDYFHVSAFAEVAPPRTWDRHESRVVVNTRRLLDLLARHNVRGTFFVLGWVACRHPELVQAIHNAGHEVACHSFWHRLVYDLTPAEFRDDARLARNVLQDIIGEPVTAYRAPSFSITGRSLWALDILAEDGFTHDASVYPIRHDRYGIPHAPIRPHNVPTLSGPITEIPGSVVAVRGANVPIGGGGYFRIFPYAVTRRLLARLHREQRGPFCFYIHPWELDPDQPRLRCRMTTRLRHYTGLARTAERLERLLAEFRFGTLTESLAATEIPTIDWRHGESRREPIRVPSLAGVESPRPSAAPAPASVVSSSIDPTSDRPPRRSANPRTRRPMPPSHAPHVLYVTHRVPHPPNRGDRIRTWNVLRFLAEHAHVSLACLADEPVSNETRDALDGPGGVCRRAAIVPVESRRRWLRAGRSFLSGGTLSAGAFESPRLERSIREMAAERPFDIAIASSSSVARCLELPELAATRRWIDLIDVDSQKWLDFAASHRGPKRWLYQTEGDRLRTEERRLAAISERLFVVTEAEADLFRAFCPAAPIAALPNGVDIDHFQPQAVPDDGSLVFVGALDYWPNIDAACWFAHAVWPEVRARRPECVLRLVGRAPHRDVLALAAIPGVEVVGSVPDVRPWLARAAAAVVPLRVARGVQNKVLEAMAMGKAVVCSPQPLQGLEATAGVHLLAADAPAAWTTALVDLLESPELRRELGAAARDYVLRHHRWESCLAPLAGWLAGPDATATRTAAPELWQEATRP